MLLAWEQARENRQQAVGYGIVGNRPVPQEIWSSNVNRWHAAPWHAAFRSVCHREVSVLLELDFDP